MSVYAYGEVFLAQDEALALAFPGADEVKRHTIFLDDQQKHEVEQHAKTRLDSKLFTFFEGRKGGTVMGYAAIDAHTVRSHTETFMVVLSPEGKVLKTVILAFHEPSEYMASERWLAQFNGKSEPLALEPGQAIAGIVGSTLSANAMSAGVRKILSLFPLLHLR